MSDLDFDGGSAPPAEQRPIPAEGLHDALCYAVVNWGDTLDQYEGEVKGIVSAVRFFFELDERMPDVWTDPNGKAVRVEPHLVGKPFVISTFPIAIKYNDRAKFVKIMTDWLPAKECPESFVGFQLGKMRGRMAAVNVAHKGRRDGTFTARLDSIMKPRPGAAGMKVVNTTLPEWVKEAREKDNAAAAKFRAGMTARQQDAIEDHEPAGEPVDENGIPF